MTPILSDFEMLDDWDPNNTDDDTIYSGAFTRIQPLGTIKLQH